MEVVVAVGCVFLSDMAREEMAGRQGIAAWDVCGRKNRREKS